MQVGGWVRRCALCAYTRTTPAVFHAPAPQACCGRKDYFYWANERVVNGYYILISYLLCRVFDVWVDKSMVFKVLNFETRRS